MEKFNKFLDTEGYLGFSYGIATGAILLSGHPITALLGLILLAITVTRHRLLKKAKQND